MIAKNTDSSIYSGLVYLGLPRSPKKKTKMMLSGLQKKTIQTYHFIERFKISSNFLLLLLLFRFIDMFLVRAEFLAIIKGHFAIDF